MRPVFALFLALTWLSACKPADTLAPRWDVRPTPPTVVVLNDTLPAFTVRAEDNRDFDINEQVVLEGRVDTERWGDYALTYRATDQAGNSADTSFGIKVTMAPRSYYGLEWSAQDSCSDGTAIDYTVSLVDCDCPEDKVNLFNIGNFGPGTFFGLELEGDYLESYTFDGFVADYNWTGNGTASRSGDSLELFWDISTASSTVLQCRTLLTR